MYHVDEHESLSSTLVHNMITPHLSPEVCFRFLCSKHLFDSSNSPTTVYNHIYQ